MSKFGDGRGGPCCPPIALALFLFSSCLWTSGTSGIAFAQGSAPAAAAPDPVKTLREDKALANGTLTVNSGTYSCVDDRLASAKRYVITGAFRTGEVARATTNPGDSKYPIGGMLRVGNPGWPIYKKPIKQFNPDGVIVFDGGGFLEYAGQGLDPANQGCAILSEVNRIELNNGLSEIRMINGNNVSATTTLLVDDRKNGIVRQQGATLMIGGDDSLSAIGMGKALGVAERFIVASGMEHFLRGGGGAPGSSNVSIIPWMTLGTIYHPGVEVVTYDPTKGIRCLSAAEYDTTSVLGTPDRNVRNVSLTLGVNKQQTINSFLTNSWDNTDIGPGSTLTITSGFISFGMGAACSIGNGDDPAAAGTINFGPAEGIIWAAFAAFRPSTIGSVITGTGGLTMAGTNTLILNGANTYTGKTYVGSGILQVGDGKRATARLGNGDIDVASGATLRIKASVANAIAPTAAVTLHRTGSLFFGRMDLESGINQEVRRLVLNDAVQPAGTYGSSASAADHKLDNYFNGPGMLTVKG